MAAPPPIRLAYVDGRPPAWLDQVAAGLEDVFPHPVEPLDAPVDLAPCFLPGREQHHATLVLGALLRHRPPVPAASRILGIVPVDLCVPVLTFVFGQAQLDGPGAVVSTYRLRAEFYGLEPDEGLLVERVIKECTHELGHAFGLAHCLVPDCVMHSSTSVGEVDVRRAGFCPACRESIDR